MTEIWARFRQHLTTSNLIAFMNLFFFILAVSGIAYLLYARSNSEVLERPQFTAETIALGALIVTSFGTLSTFIFNWRNDNRNKQAKDDALKRLEIDNAVLRTKLEYERDHKSSGERTAEILQLMKGVSESLPKQLPAPKPNRGRRPNNS